MRALLISASSGFAGARSAAKRCAVAIVAWLAIVACDAKQPEPAERPVAAKIDLNRATVKELESLPGVGPERARSIMASRNARGGKFDSLDDLLKIDGIGPKTLETIRPYVELRPR